MKFFSNHDYEFSYYFKTWVETMVFSCVQKILCQTQLLLQHMFWPKTHFEIKIIWINGVPNTPLVYILYLHIRIYSQKYSEAKRKMHQNTRCKRDQNSFAIWASTEWLPRMRKLEEALCIIYTNSLLHRR